MTSETTACPYCNALVAVAAPAVGNRRVSCSRCGETFPFPSSPEEIAGMLSANGGDVAASANPNVPSVSPVPEQPQRRSNRKIAVLVLSLMVVMAVASLVVGLRTVSSRRARDQGPLGYLPSDTNLIATIHVSKVAQEQTGREFLSELRLGPTDIGMANLSEWTGFQLEEIADVVLGLRVDRGLPRLSLVLQMRQPFEESRLPTKLKNNQTLERNQKKLYRLARTPVGPLWLWCAGPSTLVIGPERDLDDVPLEPRPGSDHLPTEFKSFPEDTVIQKAQAWVIGHSENWGQTVVGQFLPQVKDKNLEAFKSVQTFGIWLHFGQPVVVRGACRCSDPAAAQAVEGALQALMKYKVNLQFDKNNWVTALYPMSLEELVQKLKLRP
jgi:hypothetical protein